MTASKAGCVEIYNYATDYMSDVDLWGPGGVMLHELCHAYHFHCLKGGYENKEVKECYDAAMKDGLYDCVRVHGHKCKEERAYACTDAMEYFAELSVAFLGGVDDDVEYNKWFPFNRTQVKEHDPRAYEMLKRVWGVDF